MAEILIVQDEPIFNEMICELFAHHGYKAKSVRNTDEAMLFLKGHVPAVIISEDVKLLKMFSVLPCAFVMISKADDFGKIVEALKLGALDFTAKTNLLEKALAWIEIGNSLRAFSRTHDSEKQKRMIELFRSRCSAFQETV